MPPIDLRGDARGHRTDRFTIYFWLILAGFVAIGVRWIWLYRYAQPLDIDEAGYLSIALGYHDALVRGGLSGWLSAVLSPNVQAPVTTALAALVFAATGPHVIAGFLTPLAAGAGVVWLSYALGVAAASRWAGVVAALLVATCPVIVNFCRSFHFSIPVTFVTTAALLALMRSARFRSTGWSVLFGVFVGLMPLTRTMTIAFVPGIVLAALLCILAEPQGCLPRLLRLAMSLVISGLVAAIWLTGSFGLVADYLTGWGYGAHAAEYGADHSAFGPDAWRAMLTKLCEGDVYLPHFLLMMATGIGMFLLLAWRLRRDGVVRAVAAALRSRVLPLAVFVGSTLAALMSSRNGGSAFFAPVVPAAMVLAGCLADRLGQRRIAAAVAVLVALIAGLPSVDLHTGLAAPHWAGLPVLGRVPVSDGRGTIQRYEAQGGFGAREAAEPIAPEIGTAWLALSRAIAIGITDLAGPDAVVAFGFRHRMVNVNTVQLDQVLRLRRAFPMRMVDPIVSGVSAAGYRAWIEGDANATCVLLTSSPLTHGDFKPSIDAGLMEEAARQSGFHPVRSWDTPEGWPITMWQRMPGDPTRQCR